MPEDIYKIKFHDQKYIFSLSHYIISLEDEILERKNFTSHNLKLTPDDILAFPLNYVAISVNELDTVLINQLAQTFNEFNVQLKNLETKEQ